MPQMSPLYWMFLYIYFTMFLLILMIFIYFLMNLNLKFLLNKKIILKNWFLKW